jgi:flagellar assembly factor FliW
VPHQNVTFASKIFNFNKKKEKEKTICLLAPIFVNQKSKELKINMVWPYNNKSTNSVYHGRLVLPAIKVRYSTFIMKN